MKFSFPAPEEWSTPQYEAAKCGAIFFLAHCGVGFTEVPQHGVNKRLNFDIKLNEDAPVAIVALVRSAAENVMNQCAAEPGADSREIAKAEMEKLENSIARFNASASGQN